MLTARRTFLAAGLVSIFSVAILLHYSSSIILAPPPPRSIPRTFATTTTTTAAAAPASRLPHDDDERALRSIIRVEGADRFFPPGSRNQSQYLQPLPTSCPFPVGAARCGGRKWRPLSKPAPRIAPSPSTRSSHCCCCCYLPDQCGATLESLRKVPIMYHKHVARAGFISAHDIVESTAVFNNTHSAAHPDEAQPGGCGLWTKGRFASPLPEGFVEMNSEEAARAVAHACGVGCRGAATAASSSSSSSSSSGSWTHIRTKTGPMLAWRLGSTLRKLLKKSSSLPMLIFAGDSLTRQLVMRMIANFRSRECTDAGEKLRMAVFEPVMHRSFIWLVTRHGDSIHFVESCAEVEDHHHHRSPQDVLFVVCFIWETGSAAEETVSNLNALVVTNFFKPVALYYSPSIWWCGDQTSTVWKECSSPQQVVHNTERIVKLSRQVGIENVVVANNIKRWQHFVYPDQYARRIGARNAALEEFFANPDVDVGTLLDFDALTFALQGEQCDVIHFGCRLITMNRSKSGGGGGEQASIWGVNDLRCPGAGSCQDMGNFVLLETVLNRLLPLGGV